jgi:hypothetical protein
LAACVCAPPSAPTSSSVSLTIPKTQYYEYYYYSPNNNTEYEPLPNVQGGFIWIVFFIIEWVFGIILFGSVVRTVETTHWWAFALLGLYWAAVAAIAADELLNPAVQTTVVGIIVFIYVFVCMGVALMFLYPPAVPTAASSSSDSKKRPLITKKHTNHQDACAWIVLMALLFVGILLSVVANMSVYYAFQTLVWTMFLCLFVFGFWFAPHITAFFLLVLIFFYALVSVLTIDLSTQEAGLRLGVGIPLLVISFFALVSLMWCETKTLFMPTDDSEGKKKKDEERDS